VSLTLDARQQRRREQLARRRRRRRLGLLLAAILLAAGLGIGLALSSGDSQSNSAPRRSASTPLLGAAITRYKATATVPGSRANEPRHKLSAVLSAGGTQGISAQGAPRPKIVPKFIPFGPRRRAEMAKYALRHYGWNTWRLDRPRVIVEHYTASNNFSSVYNTFTADVPDVELHELPGVCSHFVIDNDGTIYQLVPLTIMCRHTVGLNYTAFGIEHVGMNLAPREPVVAAHEGDRRVSAGGQVWAFIVSSGG
jgi:N-acetylmuramoyl-L-alanine amidase